MSSNSKKGILITVGFILGFILISILANVIQIVPISLKEFAKEGIVLKNLDGRLSTKVYVDEKWYDMTYSSETIFIEDGYVSFDLESEEQVYDIKITFYEDGDYKAIGTVDSKLTIMPYYYYACDTINKEGWEQSSDGKILHFKKEVTYNDINGNLFFYSTKLQFSFETRILEIKRDSSDYYDHNPITTYDNYEVYFNYDTNIFYDEEGNTLEVGNTYDHTHKGPEYNLAIKYIEIIDECYNKLGFPHLASNFDENIKFYNDIDLGNASVTLKTLSVSDALAAIESGSIYGDEYKLPMYYRGRTVTTICESAFINSVYCNTLTIPEGIMYIEDSAFKNAQIEVLILPSTIKEIGYDAFRGSSVKTIIFTNNVIPEIKDSAFSHCNNLETELI